jgi:hypothetical protein
MLLRTAVSVGFLLVIANAAAAQQYTVSKAESAVPSDAVASEIAALLQPTGLKVAKGSNAHCEIWLAKEWPLAANAQAGGEVLYPLTPGQVIGVARFPRKASDFRDQDIPAGTYVLRYAQQPVDGAHVGTSPTRDFLALIPAAKDKDPNPVDFKTLSEKSKETSGTAHPAILSLQKAEAGGESLSVREESDKNWVIVHFTGKTKQGSMVKDLPLGLVVVGKSAE